MNNKNLLFELNHKKLGLYHFSEAQPTLLNDDDSQLYIKILFIPKGYSVSIDFHVYDTTAPTLFFTTSIQQLHLTKIAKEEATMIYYNRDFYCIQIHDDEVACDGLLFNNILGIPKVELNKEEAEHTTNLIQYITEELIYKDHSAEEMIRTYLKQIIIRATREWKKQNLYDENKQIPDVEHEFFRDFSRLVEIHYREKHSVSEYADLLNLAPKTLTNKFNKMGLGNPNELIKSRIILEAKRLLLYTDLSIKEIAYRLGYDDPAYFNRLFAQKTKRTPALFKKEVRSQL